MKLVEEKQKQKKNYFYDVKTNLKNGHYYSHRFIASVIHLH